MPTYDDYLPRINPGLLSFLGQQPSPQAPAAAPAPQRGVPQAAPVGPIQWTPEMVMRAQEELSKQFSGKGIAPMFGGSKASGIAGTFANAANGFMSTYPIAQQMKAAEANERMRSEAVKNAMGATTPEAAAAALSGVPDYAQFAIQQRMKELDPSTKVNRELEQEKLNQVRRRAATEDRLFGEGQPASPPPAAQAPAGPAIMGPAMAAEGAAPASSPPAPAATISPQTAREVLQSRTPAERDFVRFLYQQDPEKAAKIMLEWAGSKNSDFGSFKDKVNYEQELRKEFTSQPTVKEFATVRDAYSKVQGAAVDKSAAGDISMIFAFMKMLDPQSTVREGEFATAQNATGVPDRIRNLYAQVLYGNRLNDDQRLDFQKQAQRFYGTHERQYNTLRGQYEALAKKRGIDPSVITLDFGKVDEGQQSPYGSGPGRPQAAPAPGAVPTFNPPPPQRQGAAPAPEPNQGAGRFARGIGPGTAAAAPTPQQGPLDEARAAIAQGASREKVIERLRQNGIDASGL